MEQEVTHHKVEENSTWHQVTPLSRTLAMLVFIILPFLGGWVGYTYAPEKVMEVEKVVFQTDNNVTLTSPSKWFDEVSSDFYSNTATVTFSGLYRENEKSAWDVTSTCSQLYISPFAGGYPQNSLHEFFIQMILTGNTVQKFGDHGLLINLPWEEIPELDQERILNATNTPISVVLKKKSQRGGGGAQACHSFFEYVGLDEPEA